MDGKTPHDGIGHTYAWHRAATMAITDEMNSLTYASVLYGIQYILRC